MIRKVILFIEDRNGADRGEVSGLRERLKQDGIELEVRTGPEGRAGAEEPAVEGAGEAPNPQEASNRGPLQGALSDSSGILYLTDTPQALREEERPVLLYLTEKSAGLPMALYPYAAASLEGLDGTYLDRVYRRLMGLPWEIVRTERLLVREMEERDLDSLYVLYAGEGMRTYMDGPSPDREEEREKLISYAAGAYAVRGYGLWLLEELGSGNCIGQAGFTWKEGEKYPQLGFAVAEPAQGKGYASEACRAILRYGFEELEFTAVEAFAAEGNAASCRVLEKLGFERIGEGSCEGRRGSRFLLRKNG